ncbi:metal-dependent hydrolase family protein [Natranaerofaba carboxydovora]|uniref:metal-dependent hydrolase family protein n=1 Tax=Natranaerofaba carboxydovora TaxID=2742683 RepID=UPI001F13877D|nr:amidohydrolase family protein [Natranaerofaba carboxydovora]UMZ72509.1 Amidohydrolase family protein [Natranaerofaba carboxydovora]
MMMNILVGGKIFDGEDGLIKDNEIIITRNNKIFKIIKKKIDIEGLKKVYPHGNFIFLDDKNVIMPGLIDCHVHVGLEGLPNTYEENLVDDKLRTVKAASDMEKTLMAGYTTVRNAGSVNWIDLSIKDAIKKRYILGPKIITAGKIISITTAGAEYFEGLYEEVDGPEGFRHAARIQLKKGAELIKVMATGAIMNPGSVPGAVQADEDEIRAVVKEARKLNKRVAAHAHAAEGIKNAVKAGVNTIEHGTFADEEAHDLMLSEDVYLIPTLSPGYYMDKYGSAGGIAPHMLKMIKKRRQTRIEALQRAIEKGVKVACGSDAGTPYNYHKNNNIEARLFVRLGLMTSAEALTANTKYSADACGLLDEIGTIKEGKRADIIVVKGNPVKDIQLLADENNVQVVIKEGEIVKNLI